MDGFNKVRTGISGLKKEREELRKSYELLAEQLEKAVSGNAAALSEVNERASSISQSVAALDERLAKTGEGVDGLRKSVSDDVAAIKKRLDAHKKTIVEIGQRLQRVTDVAEAASKGIIDRARYDKELSGTLQGLSKTVSGMTEKLAATGSSFEQRMSSLDGKFSDGLGAVRKESGSQSTVLKSHDSVLRKVALDMQAIRKDMAADADHLSRVEQAASQNSGRLEKIGTLEAKIKHIEAVKSGLVKGVESLKDVKSQMAAIRQKTKDLEAKLTDTDRYLDKRITEKTQVLDSEFADKSAAMETQMQERLKFLEESITERSKTTEAKISADLDAMGRSVEREVSDMKRLREGVKKAEARLSDVENSTSLLKGGEDENRKDISAMTARLHSLDSLQGRVAEIEKAKDAVMAGIADLEALRDGMNILSEKDKAFQKSASADISSLRADARKSATDISKIQLSISGIKNDISKSISSGMTALKADVSGNSKALSAVQTRLTELSGARGQLSSDVAELKGGLAKAAADISGFGLDIAGLKKTVEARMASQLAALGGDVKKGKGDIYRLSLGLDRVKKALENRTADVSALKEEALKKNDAVNRINLDLAGIKKTIKEKIPSDVSSIVSVSRKNSADLSKLKLDATSMKKDIGAASKQMTALNADQERLRKSLSSIDDLRQKLTEIEGLGSSLSAGLADLKPLQKEVEGLKKDVQAARAGIAGSEELLTNKLEYNVSILKKESGFSSAAVKRLDEKLRKMNLDLQSLSKDLRLIKSESKGSDEMIEEKVRAGVSGIGAGMAEAKAALKRMGAEIDKLKTDNASLKKDSSTGAGGIRKLEEKLAELDRKSQQMEKFQVRLTEMEDANSSLTEMMEAKLEDKMKFIHTVMKQKEDNVEADLTERSKALQEGFRKDIAALKKELTQRSSSADLTKVQEMARNSGKELSALRSEVEAGLAELRRQVDVSKTEGRDKFGTAVKAFLNAKSDLTNKVNVVDLKLSDSNKRMDELSRALNRIDLLERKVDRLTDKNAELRRDMDDVSRKGETQERVTVVDLGKGRGDEGF